MKYVTRNIHRGSNAAGRRKYRRAMGMPKLVHVQQEVVAKPKFVVGETVKIVSEEYGKRYLNRKATIESCTLTEAIIAVPSMRKTPMPVNPDHLEKV